MINGAPYFNSTPLGRGNNDGRGDSLSVVVSTDMGKDSDERSGVCSGTRTRGRVFGWSLRLRDYGALVFESLGGD